MKRERGGELVVGGTRTWSARRDRRAGVAIAMIAAMAALLLLLAPAANARSPVLQSVGVQTCAPPKTGLCATASWSLPPGIEAKVLEIAKGDPRVDRDGYFLQANLITIEVPKPTDTSITSTKPLSPGTYYLHVGGQDTKYPRCPGRQWSDTFELTVTADTGQGGPDVAAGSPACPATSSGGGSGGGGSGSGGGGGGSVGADVVAPLQLLTIRPTQHISKLLVSAVMNEAGTFTVTGSVKVGKKVYRFKRVTRSVSANVLTKLHLKLAKRGLRAVKKALKRGKRVTAKIKITAKDKSGNTRADTAIVRLLR